MSAVSIKRPWGIYTVCVAVALCSILYELLLAQTLSTTMGNTKLRYNITIGLYIASMGVGALLFDRILRVFQAKENKGLFFIRLEIILSCVGLISPVLVLLFDWFVRHVCQDLSASYLAFIPQSSIFLFNHFLIVIIGLLSGLELPLLMELADESHEGSQGKALVFDYLGTLLGAVCFPILMVPYIPLFTMALVVGLFNALSALSFLFLVKSVPRRTIAFNILVVGAILTLLIFRENYESLIIQNFYFLDSNPVGF